MSEANPLVLVLLACLAVIILGPREWVSLAGFGILGVIAAVLLSGGGPVLVPVFALATAGAVLLGVRTIGMLAGIWDQPDASPDHEAASPQRSSDQTDPSARLWR